MWLAKVLDGDPATRVFHEACGAIDARIYGSFHRGLDAVPYLDSVRKGRMARVMECSPRLAFAEVSSFLRYCVPELRTVFDAPIAAVIRDGRYTVRSMMRRGIYRNPRRPAIRPIDAKMMGEWRSLNIFARICWYWADAYRILIAEEVPIFLLEELDADFGYFQELCEYLGAEVSERHWQRFSGRPVHVSTPRDQPLAWAKNQAEMFVRYAGDIQGQFYPERRVPF